MKKITRKALLTAKLYRPGKAGGGSTKKKKYTLVPDVPRREVRAISPTGSEVGYLSMEKYGDAAKNNEAFNMAVKPAWQRQGIMTALHDEAEKHFGTINPSRLLSDDGFAFWKAYRPDAVRNSYRFHADRLMGKPVSTSKGDGVISSINDSVMIAKKDDGSTFLVPDEISDQMFKRAQAEAAQEPQPEDDITKAAGGRTGYADGGSPEDPLADLAKLNLPTPVRPSRIVGPNNLYSRGHEAARALTQKKGTPQQMRAMLEKAGVKPEEFRWSGWDEKIAGKPSVTSDEVAEHFYRNRPNLITERHYSTDHDDWDPNEDQPSKFDAYTAYGGRNYREHVLTLPEGYSVNPESNDYRLNPFRETGHWPEHRNVVAFTRLSDRMEPLDKQAALSAYEKLRQNTDKFGVEDARNLGAGAAEQAVAKGILNEQEALDVSRMMHWRNKFTGGFRPKKALYAEEIQSDWAQKGRKNGFLGSQSLQEKEDWQDKANELKQRQDQLGRELKLSALKLMGISPDPATGDFNEGSLTGPEYGKYHGLRTNHPDLQPLRQALNQASAAYLDHVNKPPKQPPPEGPYVGSTPGWTNLVLKHLLTEAVRGGYDKLVISPGQMHSDMYGFDEEDPRYAGMQNFYDNIIPKGLNKLVKGMDPDAEVQMHSHILPGPDLNDGEGTYYGHSLDITDKIRDVVKQGLPMFKRGGDVNQNMVNGTNPMITKALTLARNLKRH